MPEKARAKGEYQFLKKALTGAPNGVHQGIYIVTPGGKYLQQANVGWPDPDPKGTLVNMKKALADLKKMSKPECLGAVVLSESDRSMPPSFHAQPAPDWLKIRSTARSYPFSDMELFDQRHPVYYKIDRLWLTSESTRELLPENLAVGEKRDIKGHVLKHLIYDCHLMLGCPPWSEESIKTATLEVKIVAKKGQLYNLQYQGKFDFDSNSKWNKGASQGQLLGQAVWDDVKKEFTRLKWVSLARASPTI